ncbi:TonB-dependent siderophore receptor [Sphingobacterium siyangense]|uniref:TonB-dependent siderophore receptor n=1 Tax=Sphingobacterium siyangense TaxID=459529 RepID=UPI003C73A732
MKYSFSVLLALAGNIVYAQNSLPHSSSKLRDSIRLDEALVTSKYYRKYKLDAASNTLKLQVPLLQLPQNIQEIDHSIITDQQAININEAISRNVSGVMRNNTADFYGPFLFMRGAGINTLRNGVDMSMIYYGPMPEEANMIDRLEFIKGPSGFMNAIGDPAGSFNLVTKKPTGITSNQVFFQTGSWDLYRLGTDLDGSFDKNKKWRYRLNAVGQKSRSFQRFAFNDKVVVNPSLTYSMDSTSSLTAEYSFQKQSFLQYLLTVFSPYGFASLPRDFSIADPKKDPVEATEHSAFLTYTKKLSSNWNLTAKTAYANSHMDGNYFFVSAYDKNRPSEIKRRVTYERFTTDVTSIQVFVNGLLKTGELDHHILASLDGNRKSLLGYSGYNDKNANQTLYPLDVNNPVYGTPFDDNKKSGSLESIATNKQQIKYLAFYLQDELGFLQDRLHLTLAARLTQSTSHIDIPAESSVSDLVLTPRLGVNYALGTNTSIYALYDHTFTPQSGLSADGKTFDPLRGKNYEIGLKKDWWDGKWNSTLSLYHITRDNILVTDPSTNLQSQIGQTKSKGIEFDLKGEIVKGLNAVINYAYTDSYISADANPALIGKATPYRVRHIQNTWLNYRLPFEKLAGLSISTGYQYQAGRAGRYPQDEIPSIAALFRLDAGLGWTNGKIAINGLINNLTNRFNYGSAWTRPIGLYAYVPYSPREFRLNVSYNF